MADFLSKVRWYRAKFSHSLKQALWNPFLLTVLCSRPYSFTYKILHSVYSLAPIEDPW